MDLDKSKRPVVYIASPYTGGDVGCNVHVACTLFDEFLQDGMVWPVAPLWTHLQHLIIPRGYETWIEYDRALLPRYDACFRASAVISRLNYSQHESSGADGEVEKFKEMGKPVFTSKNEMYRWAKELMLVE